MAEDNPVCVKEHHDLRYATAPTPAVGLPYVYVRCPCGRPRVVPAAAWAAALAAAGRKP